MRGLPQKQNARRADKIRLCGHLRRYKKIVKKTYIIFAELIGVSVKTLQRWDREGILEVNRTPTDRRYYAYDQYLQFKGIKPKKYTPSSYLCKSFYKE